MPDPWEIAAGNYGRPVERRPVAPQVEDEIAAAVSQLEAVLRSRGAAARRLFAVINRGRQPGRFVLFGYHKRGGGNYVSVIFNQNGLQRVAGYGGGYSQKQETFTPTTAQEAVKFAVRYHGKPAGEVVGWFVQQINAIAAEAGQ